MLRATFFTPTFSPIPSPAAPLRVERLSWAALGGPQTAQLRAAGAEADLWALADLLRKPVEIRNACAQAVWWGYVESVRVTAGGWEAQISLAPMANRIAVAYARLAPGSRFPSERKTTPWADDLTSQAAYGVKERLASLDSATDEQALRHRDALLQASAQPARRFTRLQQAPGQPFAQITCQGWWSMVAWQRYIQPAGWVGNEGYADGAQAVGAAFTAAAQPFVISGASWWVEEIWVRARKNGQPGYPLRLALCADADGQPGEALTALDIAPELISREETHWIGGTLRERACLQPGQTYWLKAAPTGNLWPAGSYSLDVSAVGPANVLIFDGAGWIARQPQAGLLFKALGTQETTAQIASAVLGTQPEDYVTFVSQETGSGIYTCAYRDGDTSRQAVVRELLECGTARGERLLASIGAHRSLDISVAPSPGARDWWMAPDGQVYDEYMSRVPAAVAPVGRWLRFLGAAHLGMPWADPSHPLRVFVESAEYDATTGQLRLGYST